MPLYFFLLIVDSFVSVARIDPSEFQDVDAAGTQCRRRRITPVVWRPVFVRGRVSIARRLNFSELMIGLTLVGFGTSLPELTTSISAALSGAPGLAVGNVVGSNIANILLILGIGALIRPVICEPTAFFRDAATLALATLTGAAMIVYGHLGLLSGLVLAGAGLSSVLGGAWLLVDGATAIATSWGVSKIFIGLTIVAVGTSLPELVITIVASMQNRSDVALGNVICSNIFNILGILGISAIVTPIDVPSDVSLLDVGFMEAATVLLIVTAITRVNIGRWEGAGLLICYVVYTLVLTVSST